MTATCVAREFCSARAGRFVLFSCLVALGMMLIAGGAQAAPANDAFAAAQVITGSNASVGGTTVGAGREAGEPSHTGAGGASVWFAWQAPQTGVASFDACRSDVDASVAVYTGTQVNALTAVDSDDEACGGGNSVTIRAMAGVTYRLQVETWPDAAGPITLKYVFNASPVNDDFAQARVLGSVMTASVPGTTLWATRQQDEPPHDESAGNATVWYRWTAPVSGTAVVDVCGWEAEYDSILAAYTGSQLTAVDLVASGLCRITFPAVGGTTYRVAVSSDWWEGTGAFEFSLVLHPPPANDDFENPWLLPATATAGASATSAWSGVQPGEPEHGGPGGRSVWFSWTAPGNGTLYVDTCGSGFDTLLAVYSGTALGSLAPLGKNDDACGKRSKLVLQVSAGQTYRIAVDGRDGAAGAIELALSLHQPPANDDLAGAQDLAGASSTVSGTNLGATGQPGEPDHGGSGQASVWYRWVAPAEGRLRVNICGNAFGSVVAAYTGTGLASLQQVEAGSCSLNFVVTAGESYLIAVDSQSWTSVGAFELHHLFTPRPANDDFSAARPLEGAEAVVAGTTAGAGLEPGEEDHNGSGPTASVWYSWTSPAPGTVGIDVCENDFGSALAVYTGSGPGALTSVASAECELSFEAEADKSYSIAVANGSWGSVGQFSLELRFEPGATLLSLTFDDGRIALGEFGALPLVDAEESDPPASLVGQISESGEFEASAAGLAIPAKTVLLDAGEEPIPVTVKVAAQSGITGMVDFTSGEIDLDASLSLEIDSPGFFDCETGPIELALGTDGPPLGGSFEGRRFKAPERNGALVSGWSEAPAISGDEPCQMIGEILTAHGGLWLSGEADGWPDVAPPPEEFDVTFDNGIGTIGQLGNFSLLGAGQATLEGEYVDDAGNFTVPVEGVSFPATPFSSGGVGGTIALSAPNGLTGSFTGESGRLLFRGAIRITLQINGGPTCQVTRGNVVFNTNLGSGIRFTEGLHGVGAVASAWESLPALTGAPACSEHQSLLSGPGQLWLANAVASPPGGPINTNPPALAGTGETNTKLTCTVGTWEGAQGVLLRWTRDGVPFDNLNAQGNTARFYITTPADTGAGIACEQQATNQRGQTTASSNVITVGARPGPTLVAAPTLAGSGLVNGVLTCTVGVWEGVTNGISLEWTRDGERFENLNAQGKPAKTYRALGPDAGHEIACRQTAYNKLSSTTASSAPIPIDAPLP